MRINHENAWKWFRDIKKYGRQFNDILDIYEEAQNLSFPDTKLGTFNQEDINRIQFTIDTDLMKTEMGQLSVEINKNSSIFNLIKQNRILRYRMQLLYDSEVTETCDYGVFIITKIEEKKDTNSVLLTCYDFMIRFMVDYHTPIIQTTPGHYAPITYPITISNYLTAMQVEFGMGSMSIAPSYDNYHNNIDSEHYLDSNGGSLGYTFRDVLDDIAEALGGRIRVKTLIENNTITINFFVTSIYQNAWVTLREDNFKDKNVKIGEKFGPINYVTLSKDNDSNNISFPTTKPENPCEIKITDNKILEQSNRSDFIENIYNSLNGLEYYTNEVATTGVGVFLPGEIYDIELNGTTYQCINLHDDIKRTTGLEEKFYTDVPVLSTTEYTFLGSYDKQDLMTKNAYFLANENKSEIDKIKDGTTSLNSLNVKSKTTTNALEVVGHNKNLFDQSTIVQGDITGVGTTRLNSRQKLWLEAGNYTFSCPNIASPYEWGLQIQNIGVPPLSSWPSSFLVETGWISSSTKSRTFTLTTGGWFTLMLRKSDNSTIIPSNVSSFNFQLEEGDNATTYEAFVNLTSKIGGNLEVENNTTIGGNVIVEKGSSTDNTYYRAKRTDTGADIFFGVGSGGTNRGIYDVSLNKWLFYTDGTNTICNDLTSNQLTSFNDTSGSDWKTMLKNKLDWCISNITTTKSYLQTFINGGWQGNMFGLGMFSKINSTYQLVWFSGTGTYYVLKYGTTYTYYRSLFSSVEDSGWETIPLSGNLSASKCRIRKIGKIVHLNIASLTGWTNNSTQTGITIPSAYRPSQMEAFSVPSNGATHSRFEIYTNGQVYIAGGSGTGIGSWLSANITWFID